MGASCWGAEEEEESELEDEEEEAEELEEEEEEGEDDEEGARAAARWSRALRSSFSISCMTLTGGIDEEELTPAM